MAFANAAFIRNHEVKIKKILIVLGVFVLHLLVWADIGNWARVYFAFGLLFAVAFFLKELIPVFLVCLFMETAQFYFPEGLASLPSLPFLIPFLMTAIVLFPFKTLRTEFDWFKMGVIDRWTGILILVTGTMATLALIAWGFWSDTLDHSISMVKDFVAYPQWVVLGLIVPAFAFVNAFSEEVVYRGVLQGALEKTFGARHWLTHFLQASAFAVAHVAGGFPNGKIGYVMVLVYGLMLGYLRMRSRGMFAPYLTHVLADLTIGYFLFWKAVE